ncbi:hypothetical protein CBR_g8333 [Chara braunii]|uniref:Uncharacterized protein n=1 Tax=Chara braunii TaxID=69332 RepID=A0A388KLU7_CHABU|nr:hypothetical protein CBR_g8333 [Chara braunii]|eukprot:GBG71034.1 hypothetical protein CBR_g8333 [Chara braunii]
MALDLSGKVCILVVKPGRFSLRGASPHRSSYHAEGNQQLWRSVKSSCGCGRYDWHRLARHCAHKLSPCELSRTSNGQSWKSPTITLSSAPAGSSSFALTGTVLSSAKPDRSTARRATSDSYRLCHRTVIAVATPVPSRDKKAVFTNLAAFASPRFRDGKAAVIANLAASGMVARSKCDLDLVLTSSAPLKWCMRNGWKGQPWPSDWKVRGRRSNKLIVPAAEVLVSLTRNDTMARGEKQHTSAIRSCTHGALLDDPCGDVSSLESALAQKIELLTGDNSQQSDPSIPANVPCLEAYGQVYFDEERKTTAMVDRAQSFMKLFGCGTRNRRQYLMLSGMAVVGVVSSWLGADYGNAAEVGMETDVGRKDGEAAYSFVALEDGISKADFDEEELTGIQVFQDAARSVVYIEALEVTATGKTAGSEGGSISPDNDINVKVEGTGSGFVWDTFGHIVTNYHVIAKLAADTSGRRVCRVRVSQADGTVTAVDARIVGLDPSRDLAVLQIEASPDDLIPIPIGSSSDLRVGQNCYAIGNPYGFDHTLTTGVVSGLNREIPAPNGRAIKGSIQTDAAINAGNSGGPLLDSFGRLIGVNTATFTRSGTGMSSGVNFAIPVDLVARVVPQLIVNGTLPTPLG